MGVVPDPYRSLQKIIKKLQERVDRLERKSSLAGTGLVVVDDGQVVQDGAITVPPGGLLLVDGGDVVMVNDALVEVFRVGVMEHGDRGMMVRRDDGSVAQSLRSLLPGLPQSYGIFDRSGARIAGDSAFSPSGFDTPHMDMRFIPVNYQSNATAQSTTSTSFVATHEYRGYRQNPALLPQYMVRCSDASTSGQIQMWNVLNSVYLGGFLGSPAVTTVNISTGTTAWTLVQPAGPYLIPGTMSASLHLQVHVRRTAGAGTVEVAPVRTISGGF